MKKLFIFIGITFLMSCTATRSVHYDDGSIEYKKLHRKYNQRDHKKFSNDYLCTATKALQGEGL